MWYLLSFVFNLPWYRFSGNSLEREVIGNWLHMKIVRGGKLVAQFRISLDNKNLRYYYGGENHGLQLYLNSTENIWLQSLWEEATNKSARERQIRDVTASWEEADRNWQEVTKKTLGV